MSSPCIVPVRYLLCRLQGIGSAGGSWGDIEALISESPRHPADLEIHSSTTTTLAFGGGALARAMCPQKPGFSMT